ncbi:MAG: thioredoxin domain-containing protein [Anaerolineales bacterium]|nr:thioredoxin domain-containing protein [Chloroflexota bacterium]MBL6980363.1 thioredoxin domain-containing protein [Anaerolineales bacterium]
MKEQYIEDGLVRFGYFHFAFLGPESQWAGEASECAAEQNAFWEYHNYLFEVLSGPNQVDFNKDNLKQFAADMGLNSNLFDECIDSGKHSGTVQDESNAARQIGVQSTPTFLINGQALIGAQPFEVFQQVIEDQLNSVP